MMTAAFQQTRKRPAELIFQGPSIVFDDQHGKTIVNLDYLRPAYNSHEVFCAEYRHVFDSKGRMCTQEPVSIRDRLGNRLEFQLDMFSPRALRVQNSGLRFTYIVNTAMCIEEGRSSLLNLFYASGHSKQSFVVEAIADLFKKSYAEAARSRLGHFVKRNQFITPHLRKFLEIANADPIVTGILKKPSKHNFGKAFETNRQGKTNLKRVNPDAYHLLKAIINAFAWKDAIEMQENGYIQTGLNKQQAVEYARKATYILDAKNDTTVYCEVFDAYAKTLS